MFKSFFTISFYISISRILGFIRDILIARFIGVSILSDAFFGAFRLPNFFRRIFAEGAFNSAFVPIFIEKLTDHKDDKTHQQVKFFVANIFSILLFILLIFVLIMQIFMPFFMKLLFPGFFSDPEKSRLLISFSHITIFYLIFISLVSLMSGILNSLNKFAIPASSPIILNLTLILMIIAFGAKFPNYGYALSWGVLIAGLLQFLFLCYGVYRQGFLVYPKIPKFNGDIKKFFKKLLPGIIGANVMQINLLVDSIFASAIFGAISYLYYADRINQLPLAMIGIAIGIALLPNLTRKLKNQEFEQANNLQNIAIEAGLILVLPATLALTILSYPIIDVLFKRGAFGENEAVLVAKALMFYSFGLPSFVLVKVMEPAFFARGNTKTPMKIAILCLINNILFNYIFFILEFGFVGIILASIISSYLNLLMLVRTSIKRQYFYFQKDFTKKLLIIVLPTILMAFTIYISNYLFLINHFNKIFALIFTIFIGILVYFVSSYLTGSLKIMVDVIKLKRLKDVKNK
ncbi:MAG: murein biosynthesis integral membrane protein MurJ [Alphaproteobacteria bacterium]